MRAVSVFMLAVCATALLAACATRSPEQLADATARYEFKRIVREFQVPASEATNELQRVELIDQALAALESLRTNYPTAQPWAAMSLRQIGQIHAERGERKEALAAFARVAVLYPTESWEIIQASKAAGDLLWDSGMKKQALMFYQDIVDQYGGPGQPEMFDTLVRISRERIKEAGPITP